MALMLAALLYLAAAVFLLGMGWRLLTWLRTPVPLNIVLTPAPKTRLGVSRRIAEETLGFRSLFNADKFLWTLALLLHVSFLALLVGHVGGLVIPARTEAAFELTESQFDNLAQVSGSIVGILAIVALLGLLVRRVASERVRWISTAGDYLVLTLLLLIIATGNQMRFMGGLDIMQARRFVDGWFALRPAHPPNSPVFMAHILFVCALLFTIPFSKLVHLGGASLLSPTLNQRNNSREQRHITTAHEAAHS